MNELMAEWKAKWAEAEQIITELGRVRDELIDLEAQICRGLYKPDRTFQTHHGFGGRTSRRFEVAIDEAFGKIINVVPLSIQANKEAANILGGEA